MTECAYCSLTSLVQGKHHKLSRKTLSFLEISSYTQYTE